ncbi:TPA: nucleoside-diphosphate kinase [Candidatus Sumerlaeota bacterium]|jgi:nucleoside-diphosphate kinase|nr:nucleoside-diphosphate kinase [Candidatus Sumerlaeota bacterium]
MSTDSSVERTLVLLKPDAVERHLVGEIITRFEHRGLRIAGMKMLRFTKELARKHYAEHLEKPFYSELEEFITSARCVAMAIEGVDAVLLVRHMMGATKNTDALPGSIRGDYAPVTQYNLVHGSDCPAAAAREVALFFTDAELF